AVCAYQEASSVHIAQIPRPSGKRRGSRAALLESADRAETRGSLGGLRKNRAATRKTFRPASPVDPAPLCFSRLRGQALVSRASAEEPSENPRAIRAGIAVARSLSGSTGVQRERIGAMDPSSLRRIIATAALVFSDQVLAQQPPWGSEDPALRFPPSAVYVPPSQGDGDNSDEWTADSPHTVIESVEGKFAERNRAAFGPDFSSSSLESTGTTSVDEA